MAVSLDFNKITLRDCIDFKRVAGFRIEDLAEKSDEEIADLDIEALAAVTWIARRTAGERSLTYDEVLDTPLTELTPPDEEEEAGEPDPTTASS